MYKRQDRVIALSDGEVVKELKRNSQPREFMNDILEFLKTVEVKDDIR